MPSTGPEVGAGGERSCQAVPPGEEQPVSGRGLPPIKGFLETSFIDWPGLISSVIFLPGCNFRCPYCHNFGLVSDPDSLETFAASDVLTRLKPFVGWIDGVVVSGGEPTLHPGLGALLAEIKSAGFKVKLDTNGTRPEVVEDLATRGLVDMLAMDLKAPLEPFAYRRASGVRADLDAVRRSVQFIKSSGLDHEFRSTIWPAWHGRSELEAMGRDLSGARKWTLQVLNYDNAWNQEELGAKNPFPAEDVARLQTELADRI